MTQRRQYLLFFLLILAVIGGALALGRSRPSASLLDTVPRDAWLVATVDVTALRASPLARPLLGGGDGAAIPGLGSLTERCGFDPVARLRQVVITAPENGARGDFGIAFDGDFTRQELARCAESSIRARGSTPDVSTRGTFTLVEDSADPAHGRVAYREGGPFLAGAGSWVEAMVDAADQKGERMRFEHLELRTALAGTEGGARAVIVTALLPASVRSKLKAELDQEVASEKDKGYVGVLSVNAAGASVGLGAARQGGTSMTDIAAEMRCDDAPGCDAVKKLLDKKRADLAHDLTMRMVGLGPLLDSIATEERGTTLDVTARAASDELASALQRILDFRAHTPTGPPPAAAPGSGGPPHPHLP